ncbi:type II toxin-antitoxin system HicA family toxin [Phaeobacter gallaeciensis]|jgi:predicted RNA binding protein YcfA (HicA-like mRNA interferase family)|uniref:type II toxin-antitoxin system HicA family toxin n=1 Tax=Phaeobacter gallaeciensis TaxID=60890 RepID=UPI00237FB444|nr:type II toxin-antitoxin system HicA family toxin [Phaeobacter gallaeciensis]MDE4096734.1 type II toxin-antitoxin system HicA family toxin [Phaeobacter gallaeciensis]MDE4105545.1 type II toxin-antitoxin system HicA family toxin [Phaeobacter gallaeciensis]MDE4110001.1 type II toxin-antitoxin system HicA family toxin [Phaeobacter gallaeciensis]MDE4114469.1 type II toxin-antitoxin system HicA family toxin [Phaeobacter gallaeciensis]MDE4118936.1 type II toxin-antitoxin system HicA family toxin [
MKIERNSGKIIARLLEQGFTKVSQRGSHVKLRKGDRTVIIPHPKRDLPTGTARNIAKQAGWI